MTEIVVKIIVELLSVLSLATKQIRQGRFSKSSITYKLSVSQFAIEKFAKKLFGESEVEAALQRLDRLIRDEIATTLSVVLGHVYATRKVTEGTHPSLMDC
jgi:hypothetical protein